MEDDIGDIFEALAAIASVETPKAATVRQKLGMSDRDAIRILALLGSMAENASLLISRCGLFEQTIVKNLGLLDNEDIGLTAADLTSQTSTFAAGP